MSSKYELGEALREALGDAFETRGASLAELEDHLIQRILDTEDEGKAARLAEVLLGCKKLRVEAVKVRHRESKEQGVGEAEVTSMLRGLQEKARGN